MLDALKNSPVVGDDYSNTTENLCEAINTIANDICGLIEDVKVSLEKNERPTLHFLEWSMKRLWQTQSISEAIIGRLRHDDFFEIDNLLYYYKELYERSPELKIKLMESQ